jgi:predicted SAM-dependent methyltransferase
MTGAPVQVPGTRAPRTVRIVNPHTTVGFATGAVWIHCGDTNQIYSTHDFGVLNLLAHFAAPADTADVATSYGQVVAVERHLRELTRIGVLLPVDEQSPGSIEDESSPGDLVASYLAPIAMRLDALASSLSAIGPEIDDDIRHKTGIGLKPRLMSSLSAFVSLQRELDARLPVWTRTRLARLSLPATGLSLHLGAGSAILEDWVNIDVWPSQLSLDLRRGLPFADGSAERVYLSHVLEHLYYPHDVVNLLREIYRVLAINGRLRIVVPDIGAAIEAYVNNDRRFFEGRRETSWPEWDIETRLESFLGYAGVGPAPGMFGDAHKFGYDFETASHVLRTAGFRNIKRCAYQASQDPIMRVDHVSSYAGANVDGRHYSLFVEAVR